MRRAALLLFLLALYLPELGNSASGTHPDEAWHLGTSAEMQAKGAWLTPTIDDAPNWFKPPLLYWSERAAYSILGTNLFAARLPSALAWVATCMLLYALGRRMYGEKAGMAAALLSATTFGWVKYARLAMMDAPMALGLTLAAYGTWRAAEEDDPPWLLAVGAGAAIDFLLKGPVGAVLVLLISGGFLLVRNRPLLLSRWTAWAFLLGAAVGLPWYVASFAVHGRAFYDFFVLEQNVGRFMHPWTVRGEATLLLGFLIFALPWTFLVPGQPARPPEVAGARRPPPAGVGGGGARDLHDPLAQVAALRAHGPPRRIPARGQRRARPLGARGHRRRARRPRHGRDPAAPLAAALGPGARAGRRGAGLRHLLGPGLRGTPRPGGGRGRAGLRAVVGLFVPGVNPPALPPEAVPAAAGRTLWVYDTTPGLFTLAAGRPVHRAWNEIEAEGALTTGGALIASESQIALLSAGIRSHLVTLAGWRRIPGYLPEERAWRSWRDRNPAEVYESMSLVALPPASGAPLR